MKPGSLVTPSGGSIHLYEFIEPHLGPFTHTMFFGYFGITIESRISHWDIPYLKVVTSDGKVGWLRGEKVEVLQ